MNNQPKTTLTVLKVCAVALFIIALLVGWTDVLETWR